MSIKKKVTRIKNMYAGGDYDSMCWQDQPWKDGHCPEENEDRPWIYPVALLPKGSEGKKGNWKITVEFEEKQ